MIAPAPSQADPPGAGRRWREQHRAILACTRCVESGHIPRAAPVFQGRPGQPFMLVGQAPGVVEIDERRPFAARSGRELARWMVRAGFRDDDQFRSLTYVTSVTKCFPGRGKLGAGDRRPSAVEVAQCAPWLALQVELLQPRLIILAGTLAIDQFLPGQSLDAVVGRLFPPGKTTPHLLPLPHPSGASRWLNDQGHRAMLERALLLLRRTWPKLS